MLSRRHTVLALLPLALMLLPGCRGKARRPAEGKAGVPVTGQPKITLEPAAYTYERDNRNQWVMAKVTFSNPTDKPIVVRWEGLHAAAEEKLAGPTWHRSDLRRELDPGDEVTGTVSYYRLDPSKPRPTELTITYRDEQDKVSFKQKLPMRTIGTSGFTFRLSLPATAVLVANQPPMRGQSWEVRVAVEIRNATKEPLMLVPFWFEAIADEQRVPHSGDEPALLHRIQKLDAGESIKGALLWRFRGTAPYPRKIRVAFPAGDKPEFSETIDVQPPER
jgi:hypothetical protein